jgi:hypothetical protein
MHVITANIFRDERGRRRRPSPRRLPALTRKQRPDGGPLAGGAPPHNPFWAGMRRMASVSANCLGIRRATFGGQVPRRGNGCCGGALRRWPRGSGGHSDFGRPGLGRQMVERSRVRADLSPEPNLCNSVLAIAPPFHLKRQCFHDFISQMELGGRDGTWAAILERATARFLYDLKYGT